MREQKVKPNTIDRFIGFFNPVAGAKRMHARQIMALSGGYTGASKNRRATKNWATSSGDADSDIIYDLPALRDRSRDLARNNPIATGAINTVVTNVVGTGVKLQASIDRSVLGLSEDQADEWEKNAERIFKIWSKECDLTRIQTFSELQDLIFRSVLESGDVFVIRRFEERAGEYFGLKLQVIEADRVDNPLGVADFSGGVEIDNNGAPKAYHVMKYHPGASGKIDRDFVKVPAFSKDGEKLVIHAYDRRRPGQSRGVPYLAPVIEALKQLDKYSEAELMAAVVSAMFTVFVKTEDGEGFAPSSGGDAGFDKSELELGNGMVIDLANGESIEVANPGRPNANFDPFFVSIVRQIGVALELPFEVLIKHFTASYSASRAALEQAWQFYRGRRDWLVTKLCNPVYEWVISEAVARGDLHAPGFFDDPIIREAYLSASWVGPSRIQLDPLKEAKADRELIDIGVKTISEVTAEKTGGDWERKHPQRVKEKTARVDDGLEPAVVAGFSLPEGSVSADEKEQD